MTTDAGTSAAAPHATPSLVKTGARIAAGTASLPGGEVPERIAALLRALCAEPPGRAVEAASKDPPPTIRTEEPEEDSRSG
jgi:hypothetical protein